MPQRRWRSAFGRVICRWSPAPTVTSCAVGGERSAELLVAAMSAHGSEAMGRILFFSGHRQLRYAAESWGRRSGQFILWTLKEGEITPQWGEAAGVDSP